MEFDFVPFHRIAAEIAPNIARHYTEMSEGDDYGAPNLDWDSYLAASQAGQCVAVTLRDQGELVGYSVFFISRNPRYKHLIEASNNGIFLEKKYRGGYGRALSKKSDEYLQAAGVNETNYTLSDDRVGRMLGGYQSNYKVWSKKYGQ